MEKVEHGSLLQVQGLQYPVVVVSNNFFNASGKAVVCPVLKKAVEGPLHIPVKADRVNGFALCEQVRYLDLAQRSFSRIGAIPYFEVMNLSDAVMGIFDYQMD